VGFETNSCAGGEGNVTAVVEAWIAAQVTHFPLPGEDPELYKPYVLSEYNTPERDINFSVYAAVYSKQLYDSTRPGYDFEHNKLIPDPPVGFTEQTDLGTYFSYDVKGNGASGVRFFARPHTKAELQAYGMLPPEAKG
jgi:hypothetical protein